MTLKGKNSGGAATQTGLNYQNRVAAWFCVQILAEDSASPVWKLKPNTSFEFLRCETEQPVDDILVGTSTGGHVFINVKHTVKANEQFNSPLGSVADQFVRQFISYKGRVKGPRPWERELNQDIDRLVLVTSSTSSIAIKESLPKSLTKLRDISTSIALDTFIKNLPTLEKKVLAIFRKHVSEAWLNAVGSHITQEDELQLLNLIWIEILDVDENTVGEREAKNLLRSVILQEPTQSDSAWDSLIQACANFASRHGGANRALLQQHLNNAGIRIKALRSYQNDIEKLRVQSEQTLSLLKELSTIRVGNIEVKINRQSTQTLFKAAESNSIVVVGEPGAGKSGALHDLVEMLIQQNRDVIFFAVDRLEAKSINGLKNELDLEHNIIEIIKNWSDDRPTFLIIDALDAARSESAAQTFYDLISLTLQETKSWRVIASIRKFDLRHHIKLRQLFVGAPPTEFRAGEFYDLCHFNVPILTDEEWLQIPSQSLELAKLIAEAENPLLLLLKIPFNLRLAGELIGNGVTIESLSPIKTQIGLLDRYWEERVIRTDYLADAREAILRKVVEAMITTRTLRAKRGNIGTESNTSRTLNQLLSSHILSEWELPGGSIERSVLTFAHHVLFDYAASRLLFRGETSNLVHSLETDIDLVLAIRPSIVMYFQHLWLTDSVLFWEAYFNIIKSDQIPEIGKLIGASVVVEFPLNFENFTPLILALSSKDIQQRVAAEKAFRHITGALLVIATQFSIYRLIGSDAPPWCELLDKCTPLLSVDLAYSIRPILWTICGKPDIFTEEQRYHAGSVARRLLDFALLMEPRDPTMVFAGIETVCKTFESEPTASAKLLRQCLEPEHVRAYGYEELFRFAQEIERLIPLDPDLVEEMYIAAFTNYDNSDEKTYALASRIVPLTSTRQQDFDMAQYSFTQKYRQFLNVAPFNAIRVLFVAMNAYVNARTEDSFWRFEIFNQDAKKKHLYDEEKFVFEGQDVIIKSDSSSIWDDSLASRDNYAVQMLNKFENYLEQLSSNNDNAELRREILSKTVREIQFAVFWRKLISIGTKYPETLGYEIRSLAWTKPILTFVDTSTVAGDFLIAIFSKLNEEERSKVEQSILEIPDSVDNDKRDIAERKRNRLLGCLNKEAVVLEKTKEIIYQLEAENNIPPNDSPFRTSFSTSEFTDEDYLKEQGVSLEDEENRRIFELSQPAKIFAAKHQNNEPTVEEVVSVIPHLRSLYQALTADKAISLHESQRNMAWEYLADACASVVELESWSCETEDAGFIKNVLLECAAYPDPFPSPENDKHFDDHPSWSPATRIDAATGLIRLAKHKSCLDDKTVAIIKQLGLNDEVAAVRFQIATRVTSLYYSAPELMWFLIEAMSKTETGNGILRFLVNGPLNSLAGHHPDEITKFTKMIFERVGNDEGAKDVRRHCTTIFIGLYLWRNHKVCEELVNKIVNQPAIYNTEAHQTVFDLRSYLNLGLDDVSNKEKERIRKNAFHLMEVVLTATDQNIELLEKKNENIPFNSWTKEEQELGKNLAHLAESTGNQVYFASGAFKDSHNNNEDTKIPMEGEARKIFFEEAKKTLELLSGFGYANLTHHLLETLEFFAPYAPKDIFLIIGKVVLSGKRSGYQYESMAADLVVKLVERFIAEFRYIFQEYEECRRVLIKILDIFVEAGWASARRLTYGVEDIFR